MEVSLNSMPIADIWPCRQIWPEGKRRLVKRAEDLGGLKNARKQQ